MGYLRSTIAAAAAAGLLALPRTPAAGEWITLKLAGDEPIQAFVGRPDGAGKHAAVIYSHGALVRRLGADKAAARGYDVRDFVNALVADGYVSIAPVTTATASQPADRAGKRSKGMNTADDFYAGIEQGIRAAQAALGYLAALPSVEPNSIGMIGYSEGGLVAAWVAGDPRLCAIVIMSPALMREATSRNIESATQSRQFAEISAPVLVTMGRDDERTVMLGVQKWLIPRLRELGKPVQVRTDYPGNHEWFYIVRSDYWNDVRAFLAASLK